MPAFKGKSLYVISVVSLLGIGTSIFFRENAPLMLLVSFEQKNKDLHNLDLGTEDTVWKYIQWDLEA